MAGILKPNYPVNNESNYKIWNYVLYDPAENLFNESFTQPYSGPRKGSVQRTDTAYAYWYMANDFLDIEFYSDVIIHDHGNSVSAAHYGNLFVYNSILGTKGDFVKELVKTNKQPVWEPIGSLKKGRYIIQSKSYRISQEWYLEKSFTSYYLFKENHKYYNIDSGNLNLLSYDEVNNNFKTIANKDCQDIFKIFNLKKGKFNLTSYPNVYSFESKLLRNETILNIKDHNNVTHNKQSDPIDFQTVYIDENEGQQFIKGISSITNFVFKDINSLKGVLDLNKNIHIFLNKGEYDLDDYFIINFKGPLLTITGLGSKTILNQISYFGNGQGIGSPLSTIKINRLVYNIRLSLKGANVNMLNMKSEFNNILFNKIPDNTYAVFIPIGDMKINNCIKMSSTKAFFRCTHGKIEVNNSYGPFTNGYSTSTDQWNKRNNIITPTPPLLNDKYEITLENIDRTIGLFSQIHSWQTIQNNFIIKDNQNNLLLKTKTKKAFHEGFLHITKIINKDKEF